MNVLLLDSFIPLLIAYLFYSLTIAKRMTCGKDKIKLLCKQLAKTLMTIIFFWFHFFFHSFSIHNRTFRDLFGSKAITMLLKRKQHSLMTIELKFSTQNRKPQIQKDQHKFRVKMWKIYRNSFLWL